MWRRREGREVSSRSLCAKDHLHEKKKRRKESLPPFFLPSPQSWRSSESLFTPFLSVLFPLWKKKKMQSFLPFRLFPQIEREGGKGEEGINGAGIDGGRGKNEEEEEKKLHWMSGREISEEAHSRKKI